MLDVKDEELLRFISDYRINLIAPAQIADADFDKFGTGLGTALQFIKHGKERDKSWMRDYDRFRSVDRNTAELINTVVGTKGMKPNKGNGGDDMDTVDYISGWDWTVMEAEQKGRSDVIKKLLGGGMMVDKIAELLGLSSDEINRLANMQFSDSLDFTGNK